MNERIRELVLKAQTQAAKETIQNSFSYEGKVFEKFAELIVRQCIEQCEKQEYEYWRAPEDQEFTPQDCADAIARHFGVEE